MKIVVIDAIQKAVISVKFICYGVLVMLLITQVQLIGIDNNISTLQKETTSFVSIILNSEVITWTLIIALLEFIDHFLKLFKPLWK